MEPSNPQEPAFSPRSRSMERWADRAALVGIPGAVLVIALATLIEDARSAVDYDLQLTAPEVASAGETMALRAYLFYRGGEAPEELRRRSVQISLRDSENRVVAETELVPSEVDGYEGWLAVPRDVRGRFELHARLSVDSAGKAEVRTDLRVTDDRVYLRAADPRRSELQVYQLSSLQVEGGGAAPRGLIPRVEGGACVPDRPCSIITWVTPPPGLRSVEIDVVGEAIVAPEPTTTMGFAEQVLWVHGPEAEVEIVARHDGQTLARRAVRLPVSLGGVAVEWIEPRFQSIDARPSFVAPDESRPLLVDAFLEGAWIRAASLVPDASGRATVPFPLSEPGLWRLQFRSGLWTTDDATSILVLVEEPVDRALQDWASTDDVDSQAIQHFLVLTYGGDGRRYADALWAFLVAPEEGRIIELPRPVSGRAQAETIRQAARPLRLWLSAGAITLAGLMLAAWMLRRGLRASRQAHELMARGASGESMSGRRRWLDRLVILLACATIALLFATVGLLLVARGLM